MIGSLFLGGISKLILLSVEPLINRFSLGGDVPASNIQESITCWSLDHLALSYDLLFKLIIIDNVISILLVSKILEVIIYAKFVVLLLIAVLECILAFLHSFHERSKVYAVGCEEMGLQLHLHDM